MLATYEIRFRGRMPAGAVTDFDGMRLVRRRGESALIGMLPDQAALHGALARIEALGLTLVEVRRAPTGQEDRGGRPVP